MYPRILVPLDRSELAEQVLPYIRLLGKSLPLPIGLLQVVDPSFSYMADFARGPLTDQSPSLAVSRAQDYLDRVAATLNEEGLTASARVSTVYGENPASEIICEGEKEPGTLIAMSTHGRSGLSRWALGSVTDKVLHATSNPLLIIRAGDQEIPPSEAKLGKVIIPLDGSLLRVTNRGKLSVQCHDGLPRVVKGGKRYDVGFLWGGLVVDAAGRHLHDNFLGGRHLAGSLGSPANY